MERLMRLGASPVFSKPLGEQIRAAGWNTRTGQNKYIPSVNRNLLKRRGQGTWLPLKQKHAFYTCPLCSQPKLPHVYCRKEECRNERP